MRLLVFFLSLSIFLTACSQSKENVSEQVKQVRNITVQELRKEIVKQKNNIQLLDVRTANEWQQGFIKRAVKIDIYDKTFESKADQLLNKNKAVYVYCRSGRRSLIAAKTLLKKGYCVYNLVGGYKAWLASKKKKK